ncbi:MAG: SDR family oxidoreductase [Elusimicrobiota bacterium]|jgi:NAD(P)-dependent dehydrogenase (short-subunit alcohol dehydrogenase family)
MTSERTAVVVGASSGMGRGLSELLLAEGWTVGVCARRRERLEELRAAHGARAVPCVLDLARPDEARAALESLLDGLGGCSLFVIAAGHTAHDPELDWELEREELAVNVLGFTAAANLAWRRFVEAGGGHLAALTTVSVGRGDPEAPAYAASKTYMSLYLRGLRRRAKESGFPITVTEVRPAFVRTELSERIRPWGMVKVPPRVTPLDEACRALRSGLSRGESVVYVPGWWGPLAWAASLLD